MQWRRIKSRFVLILLTCFVLSCSAHQNVQLNKSQNITKWKELAEKYKGISPNPTISSKELDKGLKEGVLETKKALKKKLPTVPVTLKMRNVNIKALIHAMAMAAGVNIVTTQNIGGTIDIDVKNQPWDRVFESILKPYGLAYTWEGNIIRVVSKADLSAEAEIEAMETRIKEEKEAKKKAEPLVTRIIKINFANAGELQKVLTNLLTKDKEGKTKGSIVVDNHTNSLIVSALPSDMNTILELVKSLDRPTDQIHFKAYIVEAKRNVARDLGIQWGGYWENSIKGGKNQVSVTGPIIGSQTGTQVESAFGAGNSGKGFGINFPSSAVQSSGTISKGGGLNILIGDPTANILEMQLSALEEKGEIHILSSPSLTTLDNQMAFTESGEKIPYVTVDEDGNREVKFEDAVLRLEVTPHVIDENYLKVDVKVKKDEVDFSRTVDGNPTILKKETQTSLVVSNGRTIVISGLTKQTYRDIVSGIPGLQKIPALGYLFKGDSKSNDFEEILIFITPTILKKDNLITKNIEETEVSPEELMKLISSKDDPRALHWLEASNNYIKEKKWDEGLRYACLALSVNPALDRGYYNQALAYLMMEKFNKALYSINRAITVNSNYADAYNLKGEILDKMGLKDKALKFYEKACVLGSSSGCKNHKKLFKLLLH